MKIKVNKVTYEVVRTQYKGDNVVTVHLRGGGSHNIPLDWFQAGTEMFKNRHGHWFEKVPEVEE